MSWTIWADHSSPEFTSIQYTVLTLFSKLFVFSLFFVIIFFLPNGTFTRFNILKAGNYLDLMPKAEHEPD